MQRNSQFFEIAGKICILAAEYHFQPFPFLDFIFSCWEEMVENAVSLSPIWETLDFTNRTEIIRLLFRPL
jgi:hypothetical protein